MALVVTMVESEVVSLKIVTMYFEGITCIIFQDLFLGWICM